MEPFLHLPPAQQRLVTSLATRARTQGIAGNYSERAAKLVADKIYPAVTRQHAALQSTAANSNGDAGVWKLKDGGALPRHRILPNLPDLDRG